MANPNIVNVTSIYANTTYIIPSTTSATNWAALTPAANSINKVNNLIASNVTANAVNVTVAIHNATGGGGTPYRIAYQISVPANSSLIITDKTTSFYIGEGQSVVVTVSTGSTIEFTASYETLA